MGAKIYGGRWELVGSLDAGGQSEVFKVRDLSGVVPGESALKRIRNPKRRDRFRSEVTAIKRLSHPHIIGLLDHSALDQVDEAERQFLVMPLAQCALPKRVPLLANSLDSVLQVSLQLADALTAAHKASIIHRDVKPGNVLFQDDGPNVWLADFGICLLREEDRNTDEGEVMGPRSFLAPELEHGGQLDVTPAADIYSLGKLVYYMLSGGTVLPREELANAKYATLFARGGRYLHLQVLLARMISPLGTRIADMTEVKKELQRIVDWETDVEPSVVSPAAMQAAERIKSAMLRRRTVSEENKNARSTEQENLRRVLASVERWMQQELAVTAKVLGVPDLAVSDVRQIDFPHSLAPWLVNISQYSKMIPALAYEVTYETSDNRIMSLALYACTISPSRVAAVPEKLDPVRDLEIRLVPKLCRRVRHGERQEAFLLNAAGQLIHPEPHSNSYLSESTVLQSAVTLSSWPDVKQEWNQVLSSATDVFFSEIERTVRAPS